MLQPIGTGNLRAPHILQLLFSAQEKGALDHYKQFPQIAPGKTEDSNENLHLC
jgi:hypothetical protein